MTSTTCNQYEFLVNITGPIFTYWIVKDHARLRLFTFKSFFRVLYFWQSFQLVSFNHVEKIQIATILLSGFCQVTNFRLHLPETSDDFVSLIVREVNEYVFVWKLGSSSTTLEVIKHLRGNLTPTQPSHLHIFPDHPENSRNNCMYVNKATFCILKKGFYGFVLRDTTSKETLEKKVKRSTKRRNFDDLSTLLIASIPFH